MNKKINVMFLALIFLVIVCLSICTAGTNRIGLSATCIVVPRLLPDITDEMITIIDYDPRIIYTPDTKIIVRLCTETNLKARMFINGIQSNKLFDLIEKTNGIYYGGYKIKPSDVKRNTYLTVKLKDMKDVQERLFPCNKTLNIDEIIYKEENADRIVISPDDAKTRVYILDDSLFEDVRVSIRKNNNFLKSIAYDFSMLSVKTGKPVKYFKKNNMIDIHFQVFNKNRVEQIGMKLDENTKLMIYHYDGVQWMPVGGVLDKDKQIVSANINHFSVYAIRKMDGIEFKIGPNPFTPNKDEINDEVGFYIINDKDEPVKVGIYKLNGSLVKQLRITENMNTGIIEAKWDGRDYDNDIGEDGVYIYQIIVGKKHYNGIVILAK